MNFLDFFYRRLPAIILVSATVAGLSFIYASVLGEMRNSDHLRTRHAEAVQKMAYISKHVVATNTAVSDQLEKLSLTRLAPAADLAGFSPRRELVKDTVLMAWYLIGNARQQVTYNTEVRFVSAWTLRSRPFDSDLYFESAIEEVWYWGEVEKMMVEIATPFGLQVAPMTRCTNDCQQWFFLLKAGRPA